MRRSTFCLPDRRLIAAGLVTGLASACARLPLTKDLSMIDRAVPVGAWDCHTHIYGPWSRFPLPKDAAYTPDPAPFTDLAALHGGIGIGHGVLVQAAPYGTDHSAILAAITESGGRYRGIGLIDEATDPAQLRTLHEGGLRGARFNLMGHLPGARDPAVLIRLAERVHPFGWHVLLHGEMSVLLPVLDAMADVATPIVIDHMARPDLTQPVDAGQVAALGAHLRRPNRWIKLSGVDRAMGGAAGPWPKAIDHARRLLAAAPDRSIWGSDWPHPNIKGPVPDDAALLGFILDVCETEAATRSVLVDNPQRLYA